ncbi:MAG: hypothetical protein MUP27_09135 [Desulfobacterales bacterium]|nr:hypothetical protein [Desulfobacterales bacterium]
MMIDITRFYTDFHIPIAPHHHKHARRGWINTLCPFHQGNPGYHLGYNLEKGYFFCWACGWHPTDLTVQTLTKTDKRQARKILQGYEWAGQLLESNQREEPYERPDELEWPGGCGAMTDVHKTYLSKRNFDPDQLEKEWGLLGTSNWGPYAFRVIAPIVFRDQAVSWQGRDITDRQQAKYLPCPNEKELLPHKHILYGFDKAQWKAAVVVEGITGVWRLGPGAVATFGDMYTTSQLLLIAQSFKRVLILYDGDEAGKNAADKMAVELTGMEENNEVKLLEPIGCDSGDMPNGLAEDIMSRVRR